MGVSGPRQTYQRVIEYGTRKTRLRFDRLFLQSFMAGVFVGMAGNACLSFSGGFPTDPADPRSISPVMQKFIFAAIFPVAFIAIITTGAELFTGNTMTMLVCLFERRVTLLQLLRNWVGSFLGNWMGTLFSAYFLTYLCCHFEKSPYIDYLNAIAEHKTSHGWGGCFLRGVGCNTWVCLAVWFVLACDDWSGKILALWFPIVCFVLSSYEHIIANLYTLQLCAMFRVRTPLSTIIVFNLLPTFLGNVIGGCGLVGAVYFYNFYPGGEMDNTEGESRFELDPHEPSKRGKDCALRNSREDGGRGNYIGVPPSGPILPHEKSEFLLKDGIPSLQLPGGGAGGGGGFCPAGAPTAAECSDKSSNNCQNDKDGTGGLMSGNGTSVAGTWNGVSDGAERHPHNRDPTFMGVRKGVNTPMVELDTGKGRDYVAPFSSASAETWGGESSTNVGCGYSNDNTVIASGGEASTTAVLRPAGMHAAALEFTDKENSVEDDLRSGNGIQMSVHCPSNEETCAVV